MNRALLAVLTLALTGCQLLGSHDAAKSAYDFGPPARHTPRPATSGWPLHLAVANLMASGWIDNPSMYYRLTYRDADNPLPYAHSQWVASPAALLTQRLRWTLGAGSEADRFSDALKESYLLRGELIEFEQIFDQPGRSHGVLRLRATLEAQRGGHLSERIFQIEKPAPTPDAAGGVKALSLCTAELSDALTEWVTDELSAAAVTAR